MTSFGLALKPEQILRLTEQRFQALKSTGRISWVSRSEQYENDWKAVRVSPIEYDMDRCLEEQLNYWGNLQNPGFDPGKMQLDLLFPIKERTR